MQTLLKTYVLVVLILLLLISPLAIAQPHISQSQTNPYHNTILQPRQTILYVGGNGTGNYTDITAAIINASTGDIIYVFNGTYYERITLNKTLTLIGQNQDQTIIDGYGGGIILTISATNCTISNFTLKNSTNAIVLNAPYARIHGMKIQNNFNFGIYLTNLSYSNQFHEIQFKKNINTGIRIIKSYNNTITNNTFINHTATAISLQQCHDSILKNNILHHNKNGILLTTCTQITLRQNTFSQNQQPLNLQESNATTIEYNTFSNNNNGLQLLQSPNNIIQNNQMNCTNQHAIQLQTNSNHNLIRETHINQSNQTGIYLINSYNTTIEDTTITFTPIALHTITTSTTKLQNITLYNNYNGILLESTTNVLFQYSTVENNTYGLIGHNLSEITINSNTFRQNQNKAIQLNSNTQKSIITNNTFLENRDAILLTETNNNTIQNNQINNNINDGIIIENSSNISLQQNTLHHNNHAIQSSRSQNLIITHNNIHNNRLTGIKLFLISHSSITNNTITKNNNGISLVSTTATIAKNNTLSYHTNRGLISTLSNNNILFHNSFINNTIQAYDQGSNQWNTSYPIGGNYWNTYQGTDLNNDGIGDTPYRLPGGSNTDYYPLMLPPASTNLTITILDGIGCVITIKNTGQAPLYLLQTNISITGGIINRINIQHNSSQQTPLYPEKSINIRLFPIGLGNIEIHIVATSFNHQKQQKQYQGKIFLFFTKLIE